MDVPGMSAASMVLSVAGSRDWAAVVIRRAWLAVTWSSNRTAMPALPELLGGHGRGLVGGVGGQGKPA
jgi:hypothetical protein